MTIWERIVGPAEGSAASSVLTRLSGLADLLSGGMIDGGRSESSGRPPTPPHSKAAFTIAIVALGAKMAKADGRVTEAEVDAFKQIFEIAPEDMKNVGRVFDLARQDTAGFEAYAARIARLFGGNKILLQDVLEALFQIATADEALHPAEDQFLAEVAHQFGFSESEYAYVRSHFAVSDDEDDYRVLSLTPAASNDEVRAQYRRLVSENHPDRYVARGLPPETVEIANRKLTAINAAYESIARERGFK